MKKKEHQSLPVVRQRSRDQLYKEGKALRDSCPRISHADWNLEGSNKGRLPELIPVRYGRMIPSPFVFYRGAAADHGSRPGFTRRPQGFGFSAVEMPI